MIIKDLFHLLWNRPGGDNRIARKKVVIGKVNRDKEVDLMKGSPLVDDLRWFYAWTSRRPTGRRKER